MKTYQEEIKDDNLTFRWNGTGGLAAFAAVRRCGHGLPCACTAGQAVLTGSTLVEGDLLDADTLKQAVQGGRD